MKTLGERLRELRSQHDLSLRELARKIKHSPAHLSDIELGRRHPSPKMLEEIARALGATAEELKQYDHRPAVTEIKRRADRDPQLALAFRRMIDQEMSGKDLLESLDKWKKKR